MTMSDFHDDHDGHDDRGDHDEDEDGDGDDDHDIDYDPGHHRHELYGAAPHVSAYSAASFVKCGWSICIYYGCLIPEKSCCACFFYLSSTGSTRLFIILSFTIMPSMERLSKSGTLLLRLRTVSIGTMTYIGVFVVAGAALIAAPPHFVGGRFCPFAPFRSVLALDLWNKAISLPSTFLGNLLPCTRSTLYSSGTYERPSRLGRIIPPDLRLV